MIGVLVKKEGSVVKKKVYDGDIKTALELIGSERLNHPEFEYNIFDENGSDWGVFENTGTGKSEDQIEWDKVKDNDKQAIKFIAKKLKLEDA